MHSFPKTETSRSRRRSEAREGGFISSEHGVSQPPAPILGPGVPLLAAAGATGQDVPDPVALAELRAALEQARRRESLLEQRLSRVEAELAAVYASRTWRLMAPARRLLGRAGRLRARLQAARLRSGSSAAELAAAKQALLARAEAELDAFLAQPGRLVVPNSPEPRVSILLVLFNQAALTLACLRAVAATVRLPAEVVIVDNASSDRTGALLERVGGARVARNTENLHFLRAVNQAAGLARGEALLLLNNDACLREGALDAAWRTLCEHPDAGAVGGRVVLPDGTLQEAGSIIWSDGTCVGYGRGCDPEAPEFQFAREVDYCSGAFLLLRRRDFEQLGGLDPGFAPAYYEETDFCMRLRAAGKRILYEPRSIVDHYEFASAATSAQALALQQQHHARFVERHRAALAADHFSPGTHPLWARARGRFAGRVLVIEDRVPFPSLGAGYPRSARLLHELLAAGWFVTLYPLVFATDDWSQIRAAFAAALEVALGYGEAGLRRFLLEREGYYDAILVSRPHNMQAFLDACGQGLPGVRLIYDAEAIFATREAGRLALSGTEMSAARREALIEGEMRLARAAQTIVSVSERDAEQFRQAGCSDVQVLGYALIPEPTTPGFDSRTDLLFVGALDDDPSPNTDSLVWFVSEVMPILDALIGDSYRLAVAGRCRSERITRLAGPRVRLFGRVDDLTPLYASARLFIAPTRYAAGIPLKVHEAASRGVPVVATPLLAGQLGWQNGRELLTGDTPDAFARACARAWSDPGLWRLLRERALERVAADCDPDQFSRRVQLLMAPSQRASAGPAPLDRRALPAPVLAVRRRPRIAAAAGSAWAAIRYLRNNGWSATRQRLGGELRRRFGRRDYATWVRLYDSLRAQDRKAIAAHIACLPERPVFSLLLPLDGRIPQQDLRASLDSVLGQIYPDWELLAAPTASDAATAATLEAYGTRDRRIRPVRVAADAGRAAAGNAMLSQANSRFVIGLEAGDRLRPHTLYMLAVEYNDDPETALIYADHDFRDGATGVRRDPAFLPDWSAELGLAPDLMRGVAAVPREAAIAAGGYRDGRDGLANQDLVLRAVAGAEPARIRHVPRILSHCAPRARAADGAALHRVLAEHLERIGEPAEVRAADGMARIAWRIADPPLVSVIVPTRDNAKLLGGCLAGLRGGTDYPRIEILIVDNDSLEPAAQQLMRDAAKDPRVSILPYSQPFNYSAMNNLGVARAQGEVIALLNNDIAVRDPGWLREMVAHALRPGVGAVGAKLYYGDGTIQHAGVVTGITGVAGHPFRRAEGTREGPHGCLRRVRTVACVTAACMVLRRERYEEAGGLDEVNLPVSYNDVDLCLRLRARGYRIVWTPFAELDHLESASRGKDTDAANSARARQEFDYMRRKWGAALDHDPYYSPNLTLEAEDYGLAFPPRIGWPWREARAAGRTGSSGGR